MPLRRRACGPFFCPPRAGQGRCGAKPYGLLGHKLDTTSLVGMAPNPPSAPASLECNSAAARAVGSCYSGGLMAPSLGEPHVGLL